MENNKIDSKAIFILIIFLVFLGIIIWLLLSKFSQAPWQFITVFASVSGAWLIGQFANRTNRDIQTRSEQIDKKVELYEKIIDIFLGNILKTTKKTRKQIAEDSAKIIPDLITWASDDVLKLFVEWKQLAYKSTSENNNSDEGIKLFGQIILAMQKDLGQNNKGLNEILIFGTFVIDLENL